MRDKTKILMGILIAIIVVLAAIVVYAFLIQPGITGYAAQKQQEGIDFAIMNIAQMAAQCQPVPLTVGEDTITLFAAECFPDIFGTPQQTSQQSSELE